MIPSTAANLTNIMDDTPHDLFPKLGTDDGDYSNEATGSSADLHGVSGYLDDDPFNDSSGQDFFEKMMNDSSAFKSSNSSLFQFSSNSFAANNNSSSNSNNNPNDQQVPLRGSEAYSDNAMLLDTDNNDIDVADMNPDALLAELEGDMAISLNDEGADRAGPKNHSQWWNLTGGGGGGSFAAGTASAGVNPPGAFMQQSKANAMGHSRMALPSALRNDLVAEYTGSSTAGPIAARSAAPTTALDAAPLNIALGGRLMASGGASIFSSNFHRKGSNPSLNQSSKPNAVFRASNSTSKALKSSKSEGLLARALKAKYTTYSSHLSSYNMNAQQAAAAIARNSRGSMTSMGGRSAMGRSAAVAGGGQNATWSNGLSRTSGSKSSIQKLLLSRTAAKMPSNDSTSALFSAKLKLGPSGNSRSSMQDLLRLSKKQSKTQSVLRQSSAQSLLRQTSSHSMKGDFGRVDVSSLLRPQHVNAHRSFNTINPGTGNATGSVSGGVNATFNVSTNNSKMQTGQHDGGIHVESLLHQSCRLYPTTNAVVESALRVDPDAVRRAVATTVERGQSNNVYGYPINVALTHNASMEVLRMLVQAGPDVLILKDGTDGSGSLGIALAAKWDMTVVDLLIASNPQCASVADRRGNYPLHVAVSGGLALPIVKRVLAAYPQAQEMRNFHSQTPLDIAQRSTRIGEEIVSFLQATAFSSHDRGAGNMNCERQSHLEDGLDDIMKTNFG